MGNNADHHKKTFAKQTAVKLLSPGASDHNNFYGDLTM